MSEKISDALAVDFKMRRQRKRVYENGPDNTYWMCVTATPRREDVRDIAIDLYHTSSDLELAYLPHGMPLTRYPLGNGRVFTWEYQEGDVVAIIVRYTLKTDKHCWFVAASGVWLCDGQYFMSGNRLKDRSELFNEMVYLQHGDNTERDAKDDEHIRVSEWAVRYWWEQHSHVAKIGYTMEVEGNYHTMLHIGDESAVLTIDKEMHVLNVEYPLNDDERRHDQ